MTAKKLLEWSVVALVVGFAVAMLFPKLKPLVWTALVVSPIPPIP